MSNNPISQITGKLERVFERIYHERMTGMPLVNPVLEVRAVAFQRWQDCYLGVLVTPWFMNLMLLPAEADQWQEQKELSIHSEVFPSGRYDFITAIEEEIGTYKMCSLFSPMFEFADQQAAIETAEAAMHALMQGEHQDHSDAEARHIEQIWRGETDIDMVTDMPRTQQTEANEPGLSEKINTPVSRRALLRGALMLDNEK
jgi:[NiFe] hydrogenase assembly HybE family chaperone